MNYYYYAGILVVLVLAYLGYRYYQSRNKKPLEELPPLSTSHLAARAMEVVRWAESLGSSDEYRRHQAYAKLIEEFPKESKQRIAMAIERSVRKL